MGRFIVPDTSALAAGFYREPASANAAPLLLAIREQTVDAIAPSLVIPEFLNVCRKKKSGSAPISAQDVEAIVLDFLKLPIAWEEVEPFTVNAWRLHQDFSLQTADAFFLEVARQWQAELWTADDQFYNRAISVYSRVFNLRAIAFS